MINPLVAIITGLAVARVTRLITIDYLTAPIRQRIINRIGIDNKMSYLIACPWCTSVWVGAAAAPPAWWWGTTAWFAVPAGALALSQIAGMASQFGDGD